MKPVDCLEAEHAPATPSEEILVRQLAMAAWRLRRLYHVEAAAVGMRLFDLSDKIDRAYRGLDPVDRLAFVALDDTQNANPLSRFSVLEARLERSFSRALHQLQRLRALRTAEMKKQTQSETEPPRPTPQVEPLQSQSLGNSPTISPARIVASASRPSRHSRPVSIPPYSGRYPASFRSPLRSCSSAPIRFPR